MMDRGKRSKTLREVKLVKNIGKNPQSFLEISPVQKKVLLLYKLQDHTYELWNHFGLKEDNPSEKLQESFESFKLISHRARMSGELIQGKIHI